MPPLPGSVATGDTETEKLELLYSPRNPWLLPRMTRPADELKSAPSELVIRASSASAAASARRASSICCSVVRAVGS